MARRTGFSVGLRETLYNLTMRRNSVYVTFLVIGGFAATKFMSIFFRMPIRALSRTL